MHHAHSLYLYCSINVDCVDAFRYHLPSTRIASCCTLKKINQFVFWLQVFRIVKRFVTDHPLTAYKAAVTITTDILLLLTHPNNIDSNITLYTVNILYDCIRAVEYI